MAPRKKNEDGSEGPETPVEAEAVVEAPPQPAPGNVFIRVTKFGAGKVSTGVHVAEQGDVMAESGEVMEVSAAIAASMESKGYGEIQ